MNSRSRLPNRRGSDVFEIRHGMFTYIVSVSVDADGVLREMFIDSQKSGTELAVITHDSAIAISLALQHGCPADVLAQAFERNAAGVPAGLLGLALDLAIQIAGGEA